MGDIEIVKDYSSPQGVLWKALTDPALVPLWTATGRGGRPEGFEPRVGCRFKFMGRPVPGWDGVVRCEVIAVEEPSLLRYTWRNKEADEPTTVTYKLERIEAGTRLTWRHVGFRGIGGIVMSTLLGRVRRKMLSDGLPAVLRELDNDGHPKPGSTLKLGT